MSNASAAGAPCALPVPDDIGSASDFDPQDVKSPKVRLPRAK